MTFRKVNPTVIVRSKIMAVQAGIGDETGATSKALEAHYLAGGNVPLVIRALIAAMKAKTIQLSFKEATAIEEFSVVIARHPCMLKFTRQQRKKAGYRQKHVDIDQDRCERVHACIEQFGCPTFSRGADGIITINTDLCIGDGSCMQTCPTQAIVPAGKNDRGGEE